MSSRDEMALMVSELHRAMEGGARGLSSGLTYAPGRFSDDDNELAELGRVVGQYGGIYHSHMRDYRAGLLDSIRETIEFAIEADSDYALFHVATPFPGTELYRLAREKGWLTSDNWDEYEEDGEGVIRTEHLGPEDLRRAQKEAFRRFYLRPSRLARELGRIRSPRDLKAKAMAGFRALRR